LGDAQEQLTRFVILGLVTGINRGTVLVQIPVRSTGMTFGAMAGLTRLFLYVALPCGAAEGQNEGLIGESRYAGQWPAAVR